MRYWLIVSWVLSFVAAALIVTWADGSAELTEKVALTLISWIGGVLFAHLFVGRRRW